MAQRLTEKTLRSLEIPSSGYSIVFDESGPRGFGARITCNGVLSFVLDYRFKGRQRRYTIGRHPEWSLLAARDEAAKLRVQIREGQDPMVTRRSDNGEPRVSELAKAYIEKYALKNKRPSSLRNDRAMLETIIIPKLGNRRVKDVHRDDIEELHTSLKATPYRGNRVLSLLSKMFSLAVDPWGMRDDNPTKGVKRYPEDKREGWLSEEQLAALRAALDVYPSQDAADALRLLILTGSREGEVLNATWDQFDLKRGFWTKPSHHTKQKKTEHVPLSTAAVLILERIAKKKTGIYLFPGRAFPGETNKRARVTLRRPWVQICKAAGLATAYNVQGKRKEIVRYRPDFRVHDLRHTFASHLVSKGQSLHIVGKLLGHTQPQTTQRYAHVANSALKDAVELVPWRGEKSKLRAKY